MNKAYYHLAVAVIMLMVALAIGCCEAITEKDDHDREKEAAARGSSESWAQRAKQKKLSYGLWSRAQEAEQGSDAVERAKDAVTDAASGAKEYAGEKISEASDKAREVAEAAKQRVSEKTEEVTREAREKVKDIGERTQEGSRERETKLSVGPRRRLKKATTLRKAKQERPLKLPRDVLAIKSCK